MTPGRSRGPAERTVRLEARAKINLFLRVLRARDDGYHELESLLVPISLADVVTARRSDRLRVEVSGAPELTGDRPGRLNLALVAALALADACPDVGGTLIEIDKRIPVAAGLGGGSADAAATLRALNELWGCGIDPSTLEEIGAQVGSDVPAMLWDRPVLVAGRGERLAPAEVAPLHWALVPLGFGVRSPDAYRWWDEDGGVAGPDPAPLLAAAPSGDAEAIGPLLFNDLEASVVARHPEVGDAKRRLLDAGALGAIMSGSGSAVVGLARDQEHARGLASGSQGASVVTGPPG